MDKLKYYYWFEVIKESKKGIALLIFFFLITGWLLYNKTSKTIESNIYIGKLTDFHRLQTTLQSHSVFTVTLNNGKIVEVIAPDNVPYLKNKNIKIRKELKETGAIYYVYDSYE